MDAVARSAFRVRISCWTCSFRYPNLISGFQPTLHVPPVSTVLGLLNAAAGRYLPHTRLEIGYVFDFAGKAIDVETIWMVEGNKGKPTNKVKSNPVRREFLYEGHLTLYLFDESLADHFRQPYYQLLLGRSGDLATVEEVTTTTLYPVTGVARLRGQVIPLAPHYLPGQVQALPQYFTNTLPRRNLGTQPYSVLSAHEGVVEAVVPAWRDELPASGGLQLVAAAQRRAIDIYLHDLQFE